MINFGPKSKVSKKPKKKRKVSTRVPKRPDGYFADAFTPEDIAEMNMFGAAFAKANWEAEKHHWAEIEAKAKRLSQAKRRI